MPVPEICRNVVFDGCVTILWLAVVHQGRHAGVGVIVRRLH